MEKFVKTVPSIEEFLSSIKNAPIRELDKKLSDVFLSYHGLLFSDNTLSANVEYPDIKKLMDANYQVTIQKYTDELYTCTVEIEGFKITSITLPSELFALEEVE